LLGRHLPENDTDSQKEKLGGTTKEKGNADKERKRK
jgi:hypothetical protein